MATEAVVSNLLSDAAKSPERRAVVATALSQPTLMRIECGGLMRVFGWGDPPELDKAITGSTVIPSKALERGDLEPFNRAQTMIYRTLRSEVAKAITDWATEAAGGPVEGEIEGWHRGYVVMNARTYAIWRARPGRSKSFWVSCARELIQFGYQGEYHKDGSVMSVLQSAAVPNGIALAFGPWGSAARWGHALEINYDDESWARGKFTFDTVFRYGLEPVEQPQVRVYRVSP